MHGFGVDRATEFLQIDLQHAARDDDVADGAVLALVDDLCARPEQRQVDDGGVAGGRGRLGGGFEVLRGLQEGRLVLHL